MESSGEWNLDDLQGELEGFMVHQGLVKARCLALESTFELEQPWPYDFDSPDSVEGGTVAPALEADGGTLFYFPLSLDIPNVFQSIDSVPQEVLLRVHEDRKSVV